MKRRLTKLGNHSYSITLPKTWVEKNKLSPRTDLEVSEVGKTLTISTNIGRQESCRDIFVRNQEEEAIMVALSNLYNQGHSKIRIIFDNKFKTASIETIEKFAGNFHGVILDKQDNILLLTENSEDKKCSELIMKCIRNILLLTESIDQTHEKDSVWYSQVYDTYHRIFFITEYIFRLIHTDDSSDIQIALRYFGTAWSLQCLAFLLKRIAEHEIEYYKSKDVNVKYHLKSLFLSVYDVCYKNKHLSDFYQNKSQFDDDAKLMLGNLVIHENVLMYSYLCAKLVKQYASPGKSSSKVQHMN